MTPIITVVIPVYGCPGALNELCQRLVRSCSGISDHFEIIPVNDASPDNSWDLIKELSRRDSRITGINLSRNFGQHHAITAGLDHAHGEWIVVMDCDLQDQPEEIPRLYEKALEGFDIVVGRRTQRKDPFLKRMSSRVFYRVLRFFSGIDHDSAISSYGIYSRKVIESTGLYREQYRSFGMFINSVGFKKGELELKHSKRESGQSSYNFNKRLDLAVNTIVAFSNKPLKLSIKFGFLMALLSIVYAVWLVISYLVRDVTFPGWTSVIVSIYLIGGLLFMNLGFLGLYIGKIFDEAKRRPLYLIKEFACSDPSQEDVAR